MTKIINPTFRDALAALARRDYTSHELASTLKMKGHSRIDIQQTLSDLHEKQLLNDHRSVENLIHSRRNKGYGPERIRQELLRKGIAAEAIAEQLYIPDNDWATLARKLWQKHFKGKRPDNLKEKARQLRFLQYRGFTPEQLRSVFDDEEIL